MNSICPLFQKHEIKKKKKKNYSTHIHVFGGGFIKMKFIHYIVILYNNLFLINIIKWLVLKK